MKHRKNDKLNENFAMQHLLLSDKIMPNFISILIYASPEHTFCVLTNWGDITPFQESRKATPARQYLFSFHRVKKIPTQIGHTWRGIIFKAF
jgi:hypothetical protein